MYPYPTPEENELWEEISNESMKASSGTDCTGLIPTAAENSETANYNELYNFLPTAISCKVENQE